MINFDECLKETLLARKFSYPEKLYEAMEYSLFPAGKRIRPKLVFLSADFFGVDRKRVLPMAIAIELIHNYSLIHDDMPCMDNDELRRGKPTCHKKFGEAMALLAGDALLNLAYEVLFEQMELCPETLDAARLVAKLAGAEGIIGGQAIEFSYDTFDDASITELCLKKTGALIKASLMVPSYFTYDREKTNAMTIFADAIGLAFQLQDDLLDEEKVEVKSYLGVNGKEMTVEMLNKLENLAIKTLSKWEEGIELTNLAKELTVRKI